MEQFARPVVSTGIVDKSERSLIHQNEGSGESDSRTSRDASFRTGIGNGRGNLEIGLFFRNFTMENLEAV